MGVGIFGGPGGTRTRDQLIKSQLLYRLSYRSMLSVAQYAKIIDQRQCEE